MFRLRRHWLWMGMGWIITWLIAARLLIPVWPHTIRWLTLSGIFLALIWWRIRQNLDLNRQSAGSSLLSTLGPGNHISVVRGLLLGLLAGFLFSPWPAGRLSWIIAGNYTLVSIADALDGYAARRSGKVTELGQWLDMEFDSLGVAIVSLLAVGYGQLPAWFLLVGFARYIFAVALWWRQRQSKPTFDMPPSFHRRVLAGMLMGMMTVVLWPILPPPMAQVAAVVIGIPVLIGFLRDWLFVSGHLNDRSKRYQSIRHIATTLLTGWLPLLWRLLLVITVSAGLNAASPWFQPSAWDMLLRSWGIPGSSSLSSFLVLIAIGATTLIALGIASRLSAIMLLFPIGFAISTSGLGWANGLALICALMIAFFGSGLYSLWQPEETFLVRRGSGNDEHGQQTREDYLK